MPLQSDLYLNPTPLHSSSVSASTNQVNEQLIARGREIPKWFEVGAAKWREMGAKGEGLVPGPPAVLDSGKNIIIPSRDEGRDIPCRLMLPEGKPKGVFMHMHGGGWAWGSEKASDSYLKCIADEASLAVISVGYRLAPEDPFPAAPHDCFDVAEWLVESSERQYDAGLKFLGGESAGGHLALLTALHLLNTRHTVSLSGLVLHYGVYDLSRLPQVFNFHKPSLLVLDGETMEYYNLAFLPGLDPAQRKDPSISPFYADLSKFKGKLPAALFTVGTEDCLLEDSVMMSVRWQMAGAETVLKLVPGAPHGYTNLPLDMGDNAMVGRAYAINFLKEKV